MTSERMPGEQAGRRGARADHGRSAAVFPWPAAMRYVRLWHAAGVLVYARARGLVTFAAHGEEILSVIERL